MSTPRHATPLVLGLAALFGDLTAQRSSFERSLPADTIAYVTFPDLDKSAEELMSMPAFKMWRQKELQGFLAPALAELDKRWQQGVKQADAMHDQGALPVSAADLQQLRLYSAGLALTHFKLALQDGEPRPDIGVLLHLDFGPSAPIWKKLIDYALQMLEARAGDAIAKTSSEADGVAVTTFKPQDADVPVSLNLAWVGDGIIVGTQPADVTSAVAAMKDQKAVLGATPSAKAVAAQVHEAGTEMELFVSIESLYRTVFDALRTAKAKVEDFPEELDLAGLDRALEALGLKAMKAVGASWTYMDNKAVCKEYLLCPAPERRGFLADGSSNLDLDFLRWVPKKATACSASTMNVTAIWDAVVGSLKAYNEDLAGGLLAQLGEMEKQVGFTIRDDLCGAFGNQRLSWSMPLEGIPGMGGGAVINGMFLIQMKDQERLLKCLKAIKDVAGGHVEFDSNTRDELTTYYLKLNVDLPANLPINPLDMIQPVFGFQSGYMVLGFSRADVRKTINAMASDKPEAESIKTNPRFSAMLSKLEPDRLTSVSFSDNAATFDNIYGLAYSLSYLLDESYPLDVQQLPDEGGFLSQHLFPSMSYSYTDGNGFATMHTGPFGPEATALLLGAVGTGALFLVGRR